MTTEAMRAAYEEVCESGWSSAYELFDWAWQAATQAERERCAKVCDEQARECLDGEAANSCECCADAIRKGETP